ncbi:hypothetical protein VTK56DRAFT_6217 [Thermocarpiscus australiensis]
MDWFASVAKITTDFQTILNSRRSASHTYTPLLRSSSGTAPIEFSAYTWLMRTSLSPRKQFCLESITRRLAAAGPTSLRSTR